MRNQLMAEAGIYVQGEGVLAEAGPALAKAGYGQVLVLHGKTAFEKAGEVLCAGLDGAGVRYTCLMYSGFCTEEDIESYAYKAREFKPDCVLGLGGGKLMDFSKAVAAQLNLPVYLAPTVAATCAACAPLSVVYLPMGRQKTIWFFDSIVRGVWADLTVLSGAPVRYLAAGIADAFAKSCEYSSMHASVSCGDLETGMFMGYSMARAVDETLLMCAREALKENSEHTPGKAFADAVACVILFTGIVSSTGGFGGRQRARFRIAHGYNEIIRGEYVPAKRWLHGEIVAVGILAQLRANAVPAEQYEAVWSLFRDMGVPMTLADLDMDVSEEGVERFTEHILRHSKTPEIHVDIIRKAVYAGVK